MNPSVISETPMDLSEIKDEIAKIRKRDAEPSIRVTRTEEYVQAFMPLSPAQGKELYEKLVKLNIPRMKDTHFHKIVDVLPTNMLILKAVLRSYPITVSNDNIKKILDTVLEYSVDMKVAP